MDAEALGHLTVGRIIVDEESLGWVVTRELEDAGKDARIGFDKLEVAREPKVLKELLRDVTSLDEIALTITPMDVIRIGEGTDVIPLFGQLIEEVELIGRHAIGHRAIGLDNLPIGGCRSGERASMGGTHSIAELSQRKLATFHLIEHSLLMSHAEHLTDLGDANLGELLNATIGTEVEQDAAEVEDKITDHSSDSFNRSAFSATMR